MNSECGFGSFLYWIYPSTLCCFVGFLFSSCVFFICSTFLYKLISTFFSFSCLFTHHGWHKEKNDLLLLQERGGEGRGGGRWVTGAHLQVIMVHFALERCDVDLRLKCLLQTIHFNYIVWACQFLAFIIHG
jgi:hypothetical protein